MLLNLAAWLEAERSTVSYMMARNSTLVIDSMFEESHKVCHLPGMSGISDRLQTLRGVAVVVCTSSLVRNEFFQELADLRRLFMKGLLAKQNSGQSQRHMCLFNQGSFFVWYTPGPAYTFTS